MKSNFLIKKVFNSKKVFILIVFFLFGCNDEATQVIVNKPSSSVNIYAAYYGGNFGRIFMLTNAFSTISPKSIIAMGNQGQLPFEYKLNTGVNVEVRNNITSYNDISNLLSYNTNSSKQNNLYIDDVGISKGMLLTDNAFQHLENIFIVPEGTASLNFNNEKINNIISFSKRAKLNGVKNIYYMLWNSINLDILQDINAPISRLSKNGINFKPIDFEEMSKNIKGLNSSDGLISASIYTGAISQKIITDGIFIESKVFDKTKDNLLLLGSYTRNEINTSKTNQIEILKHLENTIDLNKYNIIFKGHPREASVNDWIANNPDKTSSSYFKSFPYEIWMAIGGGEHEFTFNDVSYSLYLPTSPREIYSIFSTSLYSVKTNKIDMILGYNTVQWNGNEYVLTNNVNASAEEDKKEYDQWVKLTKTTTVPFKMTYDWINNML